MKSIDNFISLRIGDHVSWHQPLDGSESRIQHMLMVEDAQMHPIHTAFGTVNFVQVIKSFLKKNCYRPHPKDEGRYYFQSVHNCGGEGGTPSCRQGGTPSQVQIGGGTPS